MSRQYFANSARQTMSFLKMRTPICTMVICSVSRSSMNPPLTTISFFRSAIDRVPCDARDLLVPVVEELLAGEVEPPLGIHDVHVPVALGVDEVLAEQLDAVRRDAQVLRLHPGMPGEKRVLAALGKHRGRAVTGIAEGVGGTAAASRDDERAATRTRRMGLFLFLRDIRALHAAREDELAGAEVPDEARCPR